MFLYVLAMKQMTYRILVIGSEHILNWTFKCRSPSSQCVVVQRQCVKPSVGFSSLAYFCVLWNVIKSVNEQDKIPVLYFCEIDFTVCVWIPCKWMRHSVSPLVDGGNGRTNHFCLNDIRNYLQSTWPGRLLPSSSQWCSVRLVAFISAVGRLETQKWE